MGGPSNSEHRQTLPHVFLADHSHDKAAPQPGFRMKSQPGGVGEGVNHLPHPRCLAEVLCWSEKLGGVTSTCLLRVTAKPWAESPPSMLYTVLYQLLWDSWFSLSGATLSSPSAFKVSSQEDGPETPLLCSHSI